MSFGRAWNATFFLPSTDEVSLCPFPQGDGWGYSRIVKKVQTLNPKKLKTLYRALLKLKSVKECRAFFRDLCTLGELQAFSERFEVARLIDEGVSYREIAKRTGMSTATITRVAQWLKHGEGGYRLVIDRLKT